MTSAAGKTLSDTIHEVSGGLGPREPLGAASKGDSAGGRVVSQFEQLPETRGQSPGLSPQNGVELSELLTEILKRDIEINEALK